jgi:hypothetical protein
LLLVLLEVVWRVRTSLTFGPTTNPHYVIHDDRLGWRYEPSATTRHATDDFDVEIHIDSCGFRRVTPIPDGTAGAPVVVLGDSLAFGWGVPEGLTLADQLQSLVRRPVRNLAVSGYATDQECLLLESDGLALAPTWVVVVVCENDVAEVLRDRVYGKGKPRFVVRDHQLSLTNVPVPYSLLERLSVLYRSLRKSLDPSDPLPPEFVDPRGRELVRRILGKMALDVAGGGSALLIVHEGLSAWLAEVPGAETLDVGEALAATEQSEGPVRFAHDPHWTARGHAAVARAIERCLRGRLTR